MGIVKVPSTHIMSEKQKPNYLILAFSTKKIQSASTSFGMEYYLAYVKFVNLAVLHNI